MLVGAPDGGRVDLRGREHDHRKARMVLPDPCQELKPRVLTFVQDEVEQDGGDPLVLEHVVGFVDGRGNRWPVTEVV